MQEHSKEAAEIAFKDLGFTIVTGSRYLGGFIGEASDQLSWIKEKTKNWVAAIKELAMVAERYPQAAYAGLQKSLQQEWQFLQRVTSGLGDEFQDIKQALLQDFLPALFGNDLLADNVPGQLACLPVKKAGLAILDPTTMDQKLAL